MAMILIKSDGSQEEMTPDGKDGRMTLEQLQAAVGGYIEQIPGTCMFVNEDGLMLRLPPNASASRLAGRRIVGDVVLFEDAAEMRRAMGSVDE